MLRIEKQLASMQERLTEAREINESQIRFEQDLRLDYSLLLEIQHIKEAQRARGEIADGEI